MYGSPNMSHNPYFNRWFSAINKVIKMNLDTKESHNPYFNRWFSAIRMNCTQNYLLRGVTILILIDGFLQCFSCIVCMHY